MSNEAKELLFEEEARQKLLKGLQTLADVVGVTLGPKGLTVGLDASFGAPKITNDGHSVVGDIELKDQFENLGVKLAQDVLGKIKETSGDGTTTGLILLRALTEGAMRRIASGASPIFIKRGMEKALAQVHKTLEENSVSITRSEDIEKIATVSASGDKQVGHTLFAAIEKVGKSGVIVIEEGKAAQTVIEIVEGLRFDRGYISGYFCTDMEKQIVEMSQPQVLIVDKKISSVHELLNILQPLAASSTELLIICDDMDGDALSTLVVNKLRGTLKVAVVKAPGFGDNKKEMLKDLAALSGAGVVSEETGMNLKDCTTQVLGQVEKVTISKDETTIVGLPSQKQAIDERVKQLEQGEKLAKSKYDKEKLQERKAKLSGGVALIRVGAHTEPEMKQKKQAFEDSLSSTRAAIEEGVVIGGATALIYAQQALSDLQLQGEEALGVAIVKQALQAPFEQLIRNSGKDPSVLLQEVKEKGLPFGFNALTDTVEDLMKAGVIDPTKVVKNSIKFAISSAGTIILTEAVIGEASQEDE